MLGAPPATSPAGRTTTSRAVATTARARAGKASVVPGDHAPHPSMIHQRLETEQQAEGQRFGLGFGKR